MTITLLESLPDEILLTICQYLSQRHIIRAFCGLNHRLNCTISHFIQFYESSSNNDEDIQLLSIIGPYLNSLVIKNISLTANEISLASNIRQLTFIHTQSSAIPLLHYLTDLNIIDGSNFELIDVLFSNNNTLHSVYIASTNPLVIPSFLPSKFTNVKQLAIHLQSFDDLIRLLCICAELTCLNLTLQTCDPINSQTLHNQISNRTPSTLRQFSLRTAYDINVSLNTLKQILKHLTSELEYIAIEINTEDIDCINGQLWESFLKNDLPNLHRFEFFILLRREYLDGTKLIPLANILKTFKSSYWSSVMPQNMTGYYNSHYSGLSTCIHSETIPIVKRRQYFLQ